MIEPILKCVSYIRYALFTSRKQQAPEPKPPPPRVLLAGREIYEVPLLEREVNHESDNPLAALYRMYEHLVLDQSIELRNEFEAFWFHSSWLVEDIKDPHDPDPERYACVASISALLCTAFNRRIELGLPRDAPAIFTHEQLEKWRAQVRHKEVVPRWAQRVPRLEEILPIPHWDNEVRSFVVLDGYKDPRHSEECADKNILIWQPHIHFT